MHSFVDFALMPLDAVHQRLTVEAIRNERIWSRPDPVWQQGRGLGTQDGPLDLTNS